MLIITLAANDNISVQIGRYMKLLATRNLKIIDKIFNAEMKTIDVEIDAENAAQKQWAEQLAQSLFAAAIVLVRTS